MIIQPLLDFLKFTFLLIQLVWSLLFYIGQSFLNIIFRIGNTANFISEEFFFFASELSSFVDEIIYCVRNNVNSVVRTLIKADNELFLKLFRPLKVFLKVFDLIIRSAFITADIITFIPKTLLKSLTNIGVLSLNEAADVILRIVIVGCFIFVCYRYYRKILHCILLFFLHIWQSVATYIPRRNFRTIISMQRSTFSHSDISLDPLEHIKLDYSCVVCKYREKCVLLWPCRHFCLCEECADLILNEFESYCPLCRKNIEYTIPAYT